MMSLRDVFLSKLDGAVGLVFYPEVAKGCAVFVV